MHASFDHVYLLSCLNNHVRNGLNTSLAQFFSGFTQEHIQKMSGDQFVNCLQRLGFGPEDRRDGKSFDWMFEDRVLSPFLEWFCDNLHEGNLINSKDFEE